MSEAFAILDGEISNYNVIYTSDPEVIHKATPISRPNFSIVSDDSSVLTEITNQDIFSSNVNDNRIFISTTKFFNLQAKNWKKVHSYNISLNQFFKKEDEIILFRKKYSKFYLYPLEFSSGSLQETIDYYFISEEEYLAIIGK